MVLFSFVYNRNFNHLDCMSLEDKLVWLFYKIKLLFPRKVRCFDSVKNSYFAKLLADICVEVYISTTYDSREVFCIIPESD